jgi:hypothetical protein
MKVVILAASSSLLLLLWRSVAACNNGGHHHDRNADEHQESFLFDDPTASDQHLRTERQLQDDDSKAVIVEECGFREPSAQEIENDAANMRAWRESRSKNNHNIFQRTTKIIYAIPVYFHIIQPTFFSGMVGSVRIAQYMEYLNDSFANSSAPFIFRYVNVSRTIRQDWADDCGSRKVEHAFKSALKVGGSDTLNIYICNSIPQYSRDGHSILQLAGYAYSPNQDSDSDIKDGVVLAQSSDDQRLNTLVHEVVSKYGMWFFVYVETVLPNG